jgi:hypothetical protein
LNLVTIYPSQPATSLGSGFTGQGTLLPLQATPPRVWAYGNSCLKGSSLFRLVNRLQNGIAGCSSLTPAELESRSHEGIHVEREKWEGKRLAEATRVQYEISDKRKQEGIRNRREREGGGSGSDE